MGQAKQKGTREQRVKKAIARDATVKHLGIDNYRKYIQCMRFNKSLTEDEDRPYTMEEAEQFGQNQEFMDNYKAKFEEHYVNLLKEGTDR